jgi:hypothetical protein
MQNTINQSIYETYGLRIAISTTNDSLCSELESRLPPKRNRYDGTEHDTCFHLECTNEASDFLLYQNDRLLSAPGALADVLEHFESAVGLWVAEHTPDYVFVHAGCVVFNDKAIVIPGKSYSGKTTLVKAFLDAGAIYYSDEFSVIDKEGLVHPYPRNIALRDQGQNWCRIVPDSIGAKVGHAPLPVGLVLQTKYNGASVWCPEKMGPGQILLSLLENTVSAQAQPNQALQVLSKVAAQADGFSSKRSEAAELVSQLVNAFASCAPGYKFGLDHRRLS